MEQRERLRVKRIERLRSKEERKRLREGIGIEIMIKREGIR